LDFSFFRALSDFATDGFAMQSSIPSTRNYFIVFGCLGLIDDFDSPAHRLSRPSAIWHTAIGLIIRPRKANFWLGFAYAFSCILVGHGGFFLLEVQVGFFFFFIWMGAAALHALC